jgi:hypothetical protein
LNNKIYVEDQIIKFKFALEDLKAQEEELIADLNRNFKVSKIKDQELKNLRSEVERLQIKQIVGRKSIAKSNSDKRYGINKEDLKFFPVSSYSLGINNPSQKSTTLETSRSSHSHL